MPKSPRGNQKAASTDVSTIIPKSDIRRAQFKGSKSMPAVDASSPEPIVSSTKETEEIPVAIEMSSTGRPAETTNLHLKYLLQVTDSELQNMSREVPSSQTISMGVPSGGKPMTNTQLVLAPVTTSQPSENFIFQEIIKMPVSEKGVEKYHVKSDSLEQQGLKLVYTKPTVDSQEARPMSYVAYKPHSQHQSTEKSLQQQQSMTGDSTVGRKRKHPLKQGRHICQYCGRGCAKPSVLEKHIRAHTNERPFPCANCGLSFKTKSNLSKHTKSRTHALKAGLSQSASSTSSETAGTEGDVDAKDTNESEETQTETSDTDGENEDDPQKVRKDMLSVTESHTHLMRGNSEPDTRLHLEEFKDGLLLGDCSLSVTTVATAGGSGSSGASAGFNTRQSSDSVQCRMSGEMSKSQRTEIGYLQHSATPYTPLYLTEKKFYVTKLCESKSSSFEGTWDEPSLSTSETMTAKNSLIKDNPISTKMETLDVKLGTAWSKDNVPLSVSGLTLPNKLQSTATNPPQDQQSVKEGEETKPVSSLILSGVSTPSTKEMVEKRISQLISENASIVNTPMKEPPRQKRICRQFSDPPTSHTPKLDDLPQSSSMSKVSIPSIASIPLTPIPGETDLQKDSSNSPKPFLVSDKYNPQNVVNLTKSQISNLAPSSSKVDQLGEKISNSGHSNSHEIKIEIKLSKVVATTATVAQTMVGQSSIQYMPAAPAITSVNKNPENSVIKGLLMKGKAISTPLNSPSNVKTIKEKSSSVDDISKIKNETSTISPLFHREAGTTSSVEFLIGSKSSQLHKMHLCCSGPAATNTDPPASFEPEVLYERTDKPKLDKCGSTEKDSLSGSLSQSLSSDRESSNDVDTEKGERSKDEKMDPTASLLENHDLTLPKKKGRPKGSKNKPKIPPNSASLQFQQYQPSASINTSTLTTQQTSILLATLKKKSSLVPQSTLASTTATVSSSMIGQPMVSVQSSWTQPSPMISNPVSTPSTPTKLKLKGKILMKRSMSTERMQSQERELETVSTISSTGSTTSVKDSSANLALLWTSSLDVMKQTTDSDRNERNSPLKKRKVRTSEPSDTVIRPGVTRAGSEPLLSHMGQSWSGSSSMKLFAEKRLSSLPETLEYKVVNTLPSTLTPVISAPVTVPVVIAEPMGTTMKFFDSIQSSAVRRALVPLPAHNFTLPAIPASSVLRQCKETPQLPAISGLVSFLLQKEPKLCSQESLEELEPISKDMEEFLSTNTEGFSSAKTLQLQDDVGISSRSLPVVHGSHSSSQSVNSGALAKTTTEMDLIQQHLYGHSVNSLQGLTHTTLCCVQQVQPMYVAQGDNHNISMYSNWKISQPNQDPGSLTAQMLISLYNSKEFSDPIFVVSSAKSCEVNAVDSCKWSLYNKQKAWLSSSYAIEKLSNGIFNIFNTKSESSKLTLEMKLPSEDKDISHASGGSMEPTPYSLSVKDVQSTKQPKRVRIFQGGFRSNEDYIYIRGRGRGKYVCEECGIRCKKPSMLKKHIRTHTDLRPYHCRHCRLSFKTKGNLTKHMKSKAHQKKCLELGIVPVPVTVDESQIDSVALAAQSAIAKDTKILDDDNEEDEDDDKDMDDEEETDDADGQFSDSEESARTSFERMDTSETIDTSVDKESECGTPAQTSSIDVAEICRMPEVHSCELSEPEVSTTAELTKTTTSNLAMSSSQVPLSLQTLTTVNASHRQGATSQLQFVNEIAHSLLDLAQRQIPPAEELPADHLDTTDSVILITTSTATNTTITTASTTTTITSTTTTTTTTTAVSIQSKAEATEKTLKRQYSFDMADSPDRGLSKSPTLQLEFPDIQMHLVSKIYQKDQHSLLKQTSSEEIAMLNQQTATAIGENSSHKEIRSGEIEKIGSQILTHPSIVALKIDSQEGYQRQPFITTTTAIQNNQPLTHNVYLIPDLPGNLQGTIEKETSYGATTTSTLSLSLTGLLPNISQLVKQESDSGPVISASLISHPQSITPFQFEHPFQAFQRSSNKNEETRAEPQTVIIPLTTSGTEESTFVCSPKAVRVSQSLSRESPAMEMMVSRSEVATSCQQGQILLPSQLGPNNPSIVSIIVSNQTCQNVENVAQQPQMGHKHQSQLVSNSPYIGPANIPTQPFNTNIVVEPHIVENLIPEHSQTRLAELQPVSLIMEKSTTESKLLVTRQSPTAIVEKTFHSEQCPTSFERHSPKLYIDNSQTRSAYGNGQTRVHVERRIPMLQPMIPNVQLPPQEVGKLSPTQRIESASPPRHYVERLSPKRQHVERLSPTRQHVERLSPTRQHVERLSPTRQHVDMLTPTRYHVDALSPTRKSISALSPSRQHVDNLSSSWPQVDTLSSSSQPMDMVSSLRQPIIDKQMDRLSPSKKLTGDRLSPTRQHLDNLSPTSQHIDRLTTFRVCTEKLSPSRPFSSQSPTQTTGKLSPIRLTDKPPFKRQTNRLSPSRHVEGLSSVRQLDRLSPARQTERLSPGRYENLSPTRVQARLSPCRLEQQWPSDHQLPLRIVESQPQHLDSKLLCTTTETQHRVCEKQSSTGIPESQVLSSVSTSQNKALTMQPSVEGPSSLKNSSSSLQHSRLLKSFKDDLNKCHICNKCFSNAQEYIEHQRQHMKTQTHHSQDSSCGHSRPHLHKCFHSEGHADSWSMSTEEIPRPPDCKNCKMDFWKQNHLPKHLWAKKHRLTLMWNKNSSSTDSESAAPSEAMPDAVVTTTSVSGPSRVKTIQGTEKALDLSIDESSIITSLSSTSVTATCTTVTSVTTTAAVTVTTTAVMAKDMASDEHALMIAEARCVSREQAAIISADVTDQSSFFIHQRPVSKKYVDSSSEQVKDETVEADILRSGIRNPTYYVLTGDESEITGANVIPITPMAAHATHACHLCSRTFTSAYQLEDHLSHADPRPYVCEYCDAGFSKKQTLRIHLQIHSQQEKPYVCGMCGDTFVTSESLKQHSLIHSNIIVGAHRSFDESALYSYQQGTRIGSPLPKAYDRGVHIATSQLCSQDHFSTSFPPPPPPMISTPVQVSALNIQQKQPQYRLPSSQAQQYMEISPYNTGDTRPVMVASTLAALALDSAVSKP